ncbi:MAG: glycosyltransferase [Leptolyngbyaceae bacterium]|nr:glycosyltransferase [Leptolyngbyaceae bacterium]
MTGTNLSIILPTYNESENVRKLIPELKREFQGAEIIVVDDNSPDGTSEIAKDLGARVILRKDRKGLGAALKDGYNYASNEVIVSMDADCSLSVKAIYQLLAKLKTHDLVVGSKYSKNSRAEGFASRNQKVLSYLGNKFFIILFRLPVEDVTLNFRAFTKEAWKRLDLQENSNVFLLEMLIQAKSKKMKVFQIPIIFSKRFYGKSKTNLRKLFPQYLKFLVKILAQRFLLVLSKQFSWKIKV